MDSSTFCWPASLPSWRAISARIGPTSTGWPIDGTLAVVPGHHVGHAPAVRFSGRPYAEPTRILRLLASVAGCRRLRLGAAVTVGVAVGCKPLPDVAYGLWRSGRPHKRAGNLDLSRGRRFLRGCVASFGCRPTRSASFPSTCGPGARGDHQAGPSRLERDWHAGPSPCANASAVADAVAAAVPWSADAQSGHAAGTLGPE
jgi:hypothetical protein